MFTSFCASRTPCPNDKIVQHLINMATSVPDAEQDSAGMAAKMASSAKHSLSRTLSELPQAMTAQGSVAALEGDAGNTGMLEPHEAAGIALRKLVSNAAQALPSRFASLWRALTAPTTQQEQSVAHGPDPIKRSALLLQALADDLHPDVHAALRSELPAFVRSMCAAQAAGCTALAASWAALAEAQPAVHVEPLVATATTLMDTAEPDERRRVGVVLLAALLERSHVLTLLLAPYARLLAAPALALMSDAVPTIRSQAAAAFGRLVCIMPLPATQKRPQRRCLMRHCASVGCRTVHSWSGSQAVQAAWRHTRPQSRLQESSCVATSAKALLGLRSCAASGCTAFWLMTWALARRCKR